MNEFQKVFQIFFEPKPKLELGTWVMRKSEKIDNPFIPFKPEIWVVDEIRQQRNNRYIFWVKITSKDTHESSFVLEDVILECYEKAEREVTE